jgi:hypothetical protein
MRLHTSHHNKAAKACNAEWTCISTSQESTLSADVQAAVGQLLVNMCRTFGTFETFETRPTARMLG